MNNTLLIIDDNCSHLHDYHSIFKERLGVKTIPVSSHSWQSSQWLDVNLLSAPIAVIVNDQEFATAIIAHLRSRWPHIAVVVLVEHYERKRMENIRHAGADEILCKPVHIENLIFSLQNALRARRACQQILWLERHISGHMDMNDLVMESPVMRTIRQRAYWASQHDEALWIEGASGTGKESLARAIHGTSQRAGKPFCVINCYVMAPDRIETIIFGQREEFKPYGGNFMLGKLQEADQGTLLIKGIELLPEAVLQKLCLTMTHARVMPEESVETKIFNVRIICATHQPWLTMPTSHPLRKHLKFNDDAMMILPDLSSRGEDRVLLANRFLAMHSASEQKFIRAFTAKAQEWITRTLWPGNISQLSNIIRGGYSAL